MIGSAILGTRGSPLALAQAHKVASALEVANRWPADYVEVRVIETTGDKVQDRPLAEIGGKQLWTKELDRALLAESKPDLLLLFGHHLAEEKRREGYDDVEVRARALVSLNGRAPQLLIDPNVDLAKEQVSLLPARWIVPLTTPLGSRSSDVSGEIIKDAE